MLLNRETSTVISNVYINGNSVSFYSFSLDRNILSIILNKKENYIKNASAFAKTIKNVVIDITNKNIEILDVDLNYDDNLISCSSMTTSNGNDAVYICFDISKNEVYEV